MRNLKTKGFTLVELIVVIAIIGVLAAVLVPAMLGYMRDSKISQANQNAHAVYTAAQAAVTKYATANGTSKLKDSGAGSTFSGTVATKGAAVPASGSFDLTGSAGAELKDFGSYLGDQFVGSFFFATGKSGDTIEYALWSQDLMGTTTGSGAVGFDLTNAENEEAQIGGYKDGELVGIHPQYPSSAAGASSGT